MRINGFRAGAGIAFPSTPYARGRQIVSRVFSGSWWLLAGLLLVAPSAGSAQSAGAHRATREELAQRVAAAEQQLASGSLRGSNRERVQNEVAAIRTRLEQGDFRVGDRFVITLIRDSVSTDTASVRDGLLVAVFNLPDLSLTGVLRSELNEKLTAHVARYLRNVTVRSNVLTRVGIFGAVRTPGYYLASPDRPVSELVMLAGGPNPDANLNQFEIKRSGKTILSSKDSKSALKEGRTLEQLDVQSGDEVTIPTKRKINWGLIIQLAFIASSLFFAFIQFIQWYYGRDD